MSKVGLTAASFAQQRYFDKEKERADIIVNACCPGIMLLKHLLK
jgi:hypothetical protein